MNTNERPTIESSKSDSEDSLENSTPQELPLELKKTASEFVAGTILDGKEKVHEGDKSIIYRCLETDVSLPGIDNARFRLDYRKYHDSGEKGAIRVHFEYTKPDADGEQVPFAEMHLEVVDANSFLLKHRYVKPEYRDGRGIGSKLLQITESWVQEAANESHHETSVIIHVGQKDVMSWLEKNSFSVTEKDQELLNELKEHPERFIEDEVIISEESSKAGIVKSPYTFRRDTEGRYMEDAVRLTFEKKFNPKQ